MMLQSVYSVVDGDKAVMGFVVKPATAPENPSAEFMKLIEDVQKLKFASPRK